MNGHFVIGVYTSPAIMRLGLLSRRLSAVGHVLPLHCREYLTDGSRSRPAVRLERALSEMGSQANAKGALR
jgi:phage FluMu protein gp41